MANYFKFLNVRQIQIFPGDGLTFLKLVLIQTKPRTIWMLMINWSILKLNFELHTWKKYHELLLYDSVTTLNHWLSFHMIEIEIILDRKCKLSVIARLQIVTSYYLVVFWFVWVFFFFLPSSNTILHSISKGMT